MVYLDSFSFPDGEEEFDFFMGVKRNCYDSYYPFGQVSKKEISILNFEDITILYGGNGSGKTTILNVIAEKLELKRESVYNRSNFFPDYIALCDGALSRDLTEHSRIITSDDVFDYMLGVRTLNEGINTKREELYQEYLDAKYSDFHYRTMEDFERLKQVNLARRKTQSKYVRAKLMDNIREHSNGENAFRYFQEKVEESALYLLDEPENSLSPGTAVGACEVYRRGGNVFELPVYYLYSLSVFVGDEGGKDLRFGYDACAAQEMDAA